MYISVADECVALFNLILPVPGSDAMPVAPVNV